MYAAVRDSRCTCFLWRTWSAYRLSITNGVSLYFISQMLMHRSARSITRSI